MGRQFQLKGLENCNFKCLTDCPVPPGSYRDSDCIYDDPDPNIFDRVEYPEFFWWRFDQIFCDYNGDLLILPDMMDEYFKEPEDKTQTRCPRCYSAHVDVGYPYIQCSHCGYNEPLIDFPISQAFNEGGNNGNTG